MASISRTKVGDRVFSVMGVSRYPVTSRAGTIAIFWGGIITRPKVVVEVFSLLCNVATFFLERYHVRWFFRGNVVGLVLYFCLFGFGRFVYLYLILDCRPVSRCGDLLIFLVRINVPNEVRILHLSSFYVQ